MDSQVMLAQQLHFETTGDVLLLLGHEQTQNLGGQRAQRLPVDQLHFPTLRAIHHLEVERKWQLVYWHFTSDLENTGPTKRG